MAQDYSIRLTGDSSQLEKALNDVKERFERTSASVKPLRQKLSELRKQMEQIATSELSQTTEGQELYNKLREAAQQYDKTLKQIQADSRIAADATTEQAQSSQSLSQKVADIKKQMEELALSGKMNSDEGKEMWDKLSQEAQEYDDILKKIQKDTKSSTSVSLPNDSDSKPAIDLKGVGTDLLGKAGLGAGATKALGALAGAINPVTLGLTAVGGTMIAAGKATAEFETHLNSLQSLTGLTDKEMKSINDGAIEMSKGFKSSAGEIVDAMKLIGSQAPELLKNSDALMEVTKAANVLSEAAEISVEDAAKAITGTMNQMGASASQATDIINTFAPASQQGSADVAYLNTAFEKSGTAASDAGMDYVQLASAIEAIAPKFSSADRAGEHLASTLLKLSMSGNQDFMPSVVGMSKALENLANAEMDDVSMKNLVGESNITMLKSLIQAREQFDSYSESLRGTNTAIEQMEINQKGFLGMVNKMKSVWEAFLLVLGQSGVIDGIMDNLSAVIEFIGELCNAVGDIIKAFKLFNVSAEDTTPPLMDFKKQLEMLTTVIKYVGDAIEIVIAIIAKVVGYIQEFISWIKTCMTNVTDSTNSMGQSWKNFIKIMTDNKFVQKLLGYFRQIKKWFSDMVDGCKKQWNDFIDLLGLGDDKKIGVPKKEEKKEVVTTKQKTVNETETKSTSASTSTKSSKSSSTKEKQIDYLVSVDDKTLDTAEKKLSAWQSKQKTIKIDDVEGLKECSEQIKKWQDEVQKRKLMIEFGNQIFDNLTALQNQLKEVENLKSLMLSVDFDDDDAQNELTEFLNEVNLLNGNTVNINVAISSSPEKLDKEIEDLKNQILIESIKIGFKPEIEKGSKTDIEQEIKKLEDVKKILFQTNADPATVKKVDDEIKNLKKNLEKEEIRLGIKPEIQSGSLNEIKKKIKEKEDEINLALNTDVDADSMRKLQSELENLRKQEREKSIEIGVTKNVATISKNSESWERGSVEDKRQSLSNAQSMVKEIQENYKLKLIEKEDVETQLSQINEQLESLGLKPITLTFNDDGTLTTAAENLEKYKNQMSAVSEMTGAMGNVFGSLGSAIGGTTGEVMNFAGQSINAIAQIIPQIVAMISAKEAEAIAAGTASGASMPFPANIAAIAGIVATIASVFASLPKFESGGIVGGSSFTGDKLLARVNSGEMILNKTQQKNLYNSMSYAEVGTPMQNTLKGDVNFTISGAALKGTLKNYDTKMSRIK